MNITAENKHYYRIMDLKKEDLKLELAKWTREDLQDWLKWNDPNGIYDDEQSLDEIGHIMTYEEGVEIMIRQIIQE